MRNAEKPDEFTAILINEVLFAFLFQRNFWVACSRLCKRKLNQNLNKLLRFTSRDILFLGKSLFENTLWFRQCRNKLFSLKWKKIFAFFGICFIIWDPFTWRVCRYFNYLFLFVFRCKVMLFVCLVDDFLTLVCSGLKWASWQYCKTAWLHKRWKFVATICMLNLV